jgi:FKBP-type peptidyl-prolyl cis-trans isomerase
MLERRMRSLFLALGLTALALPGCGETVAPERHVSCDPFLVQLSPAPGDTVTTPQGLRYIDIQAGTGAAANIGSMVDVNYSGYLLATGQQFDTSCPEGRTVLRVTLGTGRVIPGFEMGLIGMQQNGVRRLIIPPGLGYGASPQGPIPGNSTLIFDLHVVDVR